MNIRKLASGAAVTVLMLVASLPARAGIPVIDGANLAQAVQGIIAWGQQARQMVEQYNKLQEQYTQLQTMTSRLEGMRNLGTILNDPNVLAALPPDMRDSTRLLMNPSALVTNPASLNQILASFGVDTTANAAAGQAAADTLGRATQIMASTQARMAQLQALATRVDTTFDAKDSLDMLNRNALEAATINNQMMQTMASLEAARQAAELKRLAADQAFFAEMRAGGAQPVRELTY